MASKSGGMRKIGRNKISCSVYKNSGRREHNKARRLKKHLVRFPNDDCAKSALNTLGR